MQLEDKIKELNITNIEEYDIETKKINTKLPPRNLLVIFLKLILLNFYNTQNGIFNLFIL